jgi:hypothetical protein
MAEKRHEQSGFKVTDRRLFTSDGELRADLPEEQEARIETPKAQSPAASKDGSPKDGLLKNDEFKDIPAAVKPPAAVAADSCAAPVSPTPDREMPIPPTSAEQEAQAAAYRQSSKDLDSEVELSGHSAKDFEITFERFLASLYMTAMMQLGLMRQQGAQPQVDIIGARQTIDTLSLISEKTKGNLTPAEENFLQNSLYELRMAYVEVTNALARPPQPGPATGIKTGTKGR